MGSSARPTDLFDFHDAPMLMPENRPDTAEIREAAWSMTPTAGIIDWFNEEDYVVDPLFKPDMKTLDRRFWNISDGLSKARSLDEFRGIQDREVKRQDAILTISEGGAAAMGTAIGMDMLDPVMLPLWFVPFIGPATRVANIAKFGAVIAGELGAREVIAHYQQPSRTAKDTVPIVVAGTILGMAFGAVIRPSIANVPKKTTDRMVREQKKAYDSVIDDFDDATGQSVGATTAESAYGAPAKMSNERALTPAWVKKVTIKNPKYRMSHSTEHYLAEPSAIIDELIRTHVPRARDTMGKVPRYPAGKIVPWDEEVRMTKNYLTAFSAGKKKQAQKLLKENGIKMSLKEVDELLNRIYKYGDDSEFGKGLDFLYPLIGDLRETKRILGERGESVHMFGYKQVADEDGNMVDLIVDGFKVPRKISDLPKYAPHSSTRIYDRVAIAANPGEFVRDVIREYKRMGDTRSIEELEERALNAYSNITSSAKINPGDGNRVANHFGPPTSKPITLEVMDRGIDKWLIHSMDAEFASLTRDYIPILTGLERYGVGGLEYTPKGMKVPSLWKRAEEEFLDKRADYLKTDSVKLEKMTKGHGQDMVDMQHLVNKITGADRYLGILDRRYGRALNEVRNWTSFAWLGNASLASVHEVARSQIIHGLGPVAKSMGLLINPTELLKANINQLKAFGFALDTASIRSSAMMRADVEESIATRGISSFASRHVEKVYQYSGMHHLLSGMKQVEALSFLTDVVDFAIRKQSPKAGSGAYKSAMRNFTRYGIKPDDFERIAKEVSTGGIVQERGVWLIDSHKFKDGELLYKIQQITASAGETSVVVGGIGSLPIVLDNPVGHTIAQFKRVFFGYSGRMGNLALSLSEGDIRAAGGLLSSFSIAWLAWQVRMFMRHVGDNPNTAAQEFMKEWEATAPQDHLREMVERTGYTGLLFEMFSQADTVANGGLSHAMRLNEGSKHFYRDSSLVGNFAPSISYLEKALKAVAAPFKEGGATQKDMKNLSQIMPLRTILYLDPIFDQIARTAGSSLPQGTQRRSRYRKAETEGVTYQ